MPSAVATVRSRAKKTSTAAPRSLGGYWASSRSPLTSLLFVLPLLILHEVGVRRYGPFLEQRITAFSLLTQFFNYFGAYGRSLPAMAVVAILLTWHVARKDVFEFRIGHVLIMVFESFLLAIPLV